MRAYVAQGSFRAGELSPRFDGRTETDEYRSGLALLENGWVRPQGTIERRPGTTFVASVKDHARKVQLVPFVFSDVQAYVLEIGHLYIRFFMNSGQIYSGPTPYEIAAPWTEADLPQLRWTQSADLMILVHPNYRPRRLTRTGHAAWTLTPITFVDGPYLDQNTDAAKTLTPSGTSGTITLTASGFAPFAAGHVGSLWRLTHGSTTGYVEITSVTSGTVANATVKKTLGGTTATSLWSEGAWSDVRGWPRTVVLTPWGRAVYGGTATQPQTIWLSRPALWDDFTPGTAADSAMSLTLASRRVNVIRWLHPSGRGLLIGTAGEEFELRSSGGPITPTSVMVQAVGAYGSASVDAVAVGHSPVFVSRSSRRIRGLVYQFDSDAYTAVDLSYTAEHLLRAAGVVQLAVQDDPTTVLWALREDGVLLSFVYEPTLKVTAWSRQRTQGFFESLAVIPHPAADRDQVWVVVRRTIQGQVRRYVEHLNMRDGYYSDFTVDSGLQYVGPPVTAVSGLDHLEGETVHILGDGAVHPPQVVSGGSVPLQRAASTVEAGLPFTTIVQTLRLEPPNEGGQALGRKRRLGKVGVLLYESLGGVLQGTPLDSRVGSDLMDAAPPLVTGLRVVEDLGWDRSGVISFVQPQPLPVEITSFVAIQQTEDL